MEKNQNIKMFVSCRNANGSADMFVCVVEVTQDQFDNGEHYDLACDQAEQNGYEQPFLCYDENETKNIARHFAKDKNPSTSSGDVVHAFELFDYSNKGDSTKGKVCVSSHGITVSLEGYSDKGSVDNEGSPIFIERDKGEIVIRLYEDINRSDATKVLLLNGARNEKRL
jgi:hypothetical protein